MQLLQSIAHGAQTRRSGAQARDGGSRRHGTQRPGAQALPTPLVIHLSRRRLAAMQLVHDARTVDLRRGRRPPLRREPIDRGEVVAFPMLGRRHLEDLALCSQLAVGPVLGSVHAACRVELLVGGVWGVGVLVEGAVFGVFGVEVREADVFGGGRGGWSLAARSAEEEVEQASCQDENEDTGDCCTSNDTSAYGF